MRSSGIATECSKWWTKSLYSGSEGACGIVWLNTSQFLFFSHKLIFSWLMKLTLHTHTQVAIDPHTQWSSEQISGALHRLRWPANPIFLKSPLTQLWSFSSVQQAMCAFSLLILHSGSCFQAEIQVIIEFTCFSYFMNACCLISKNYCYILFVLFSGCLPLIAKLKMSGLILFLFCWLSICGFWRKEHLIFMCAIITPVIPNNEEYNFNCIIECLDAVVLTRFSALIEEQKATTIPVNKLQHQR